MRQNSELVNQESVAEVADRDAFARVGKRNFGKGIAAAISVLTICVVLSPIFENWSAEPRDGFPLSHYPMFSRKRDKNVTISYIVGYDKLGEPHRIRYSYAGAGGLNQIRKQMRSVIRRGEGVNLCRKIARRLARKKRGPLADVVKVAILTGKFNPDDYFHGDTAPASLRVEASCRVKRKRR